MDDLLTWLGAQLDEDERLARVVDALTCPPWAFAGLVITDAERHPVASADDGEPATADHIARWDPARILAEVDVKRRILDRVAAAPWLPVDADNDEPEYAYGYARGLSDTLRLLALPYASQPGYREEWRP